MPLIWVGDKRPRQLFIYTHRCPCKCRRDVWLSGSFPGRHRARRFSSVKFSWDPTRLFHVSTPSRRKTPNGLVLHVSWSNCHKRTDKNLRRVSPSGPSTSSYTKLQVKSEEHFIYDLSPPIYLFFFANTTRFKTNISKVNEGWNHLTHQNLSNV